VIRVVLPGHLRTLAAISGEVALEVPPPVTLGAVLDALEEAHPVLRGAVRDRATLQRRAFVRYFACEEDLSHEPAEFELPDRVVSGVEPFVVIGAMAGG
jgi:molybdopterin synthase sulfur carrier subunit